MAINTDSPVAFDSETETYRLYADWQSDEPVSMSVLRGVAAVTNTPITDMDPLFETVDPEALDDLYDPAAGDRERADTRVAFRFNGCDVVVYAAGEIEISPVEDDNPITDPVPRSLRDR